MFRKPSTEELTRRGIQAVRELEAVIDQCKALSDTAALRAIADRLEGIEVHAGCHTRQRQ
jgi:hypothetical protein